MSPRLTVRAVEDVTFEIGRGEILGLVGESGSGKSTLGRAVLRVTDLTDGRVVFDGQDVSTLSKRQLRPLRARMQMIFQDPFASLNPRMTVGQIVGAPLRIQNPGISRSEVEARVGDALRTVGLADSHAERYPHEFSGGQRQRIGIARAFVLAPDFLVADEPVSALDVSIQAQVVNLLMEIKRKLDLTILFISHDLAVVGHVCDRVAVMYLGRIVEIADTRTLFRNPRHPYTEALFSAVPVADPSRRRQRILLKGDLPSPLAPPSGCAFRTRCRYAIPACAEAVPPLAHIGGGHQKACIRDDLALQPAC
ncbi:ABC transporter ATP-binding protein [Lichenifustis flavocetrariae]|uniref:ATP-binding cassette domain-containing protein n=1 Tax=Lichenifustis flavocetrariae TaxID=2949735 RepID=A0AA41Z2U2_9HYPH|nr:oligopeptide/dipeptide ABC transporter ATP-binding protein [Lichenifustis flavocetrariae]MCW6508262.1 ATP-binding cassette domain-containing protein [Lichenifustis flavocetrariae]